MVLVIDDPLCGEGPRLPGSVPWAVPPPLLVLLHASRLAQVSWTASAPLHPCRKKKQREKERKVGTVEQDSHMTSSFPIRLCVCDYAATHRWRRILSASFETFHVGKHFRDQVSLPQPVFDADISRTPRNERL